MIRIEIQAEIAEVNALIALLETDAKFKNIAQQVVNAKAQSEHNQLAEIPVEGDDEYIERSE